MPTVGDADGETITERGAARYLGVYFSFEGVGGNPWAEQDRYTTRIVDSFFTRLSFFNPTPQQYNQAIEGVLISKLMYGWRVHFASRYGSTHSTVRLTFFLQ